MTTIPKRSSIRLFSSVSIFVHGANRTTRWPDSNGGHDFRVIINIGTLVRRIGCVQYSFHRIQEIDT